VKKPKYRDTPRFLEIKCTREGRSFKESSIIQSKGISQDNGDKEGEKIE